MIGLTARQLELLRFIRGYQIANGGVSPTLVECAAGLGVFSTNTIHVHLTALEERGAIRRLPRQSRAIEIIEIIETPTIPSINGAPLYAVPLVATRSTTFSQERL